MYKYIQPLKKWFLLGFLIVGCVLLIYYDAPSYLTFETIKKYQSVAQRWTETHYLTAVTVYIAVFTFLIACAIPAATVMTLIGGFLFGIIGFIYAEIGTTLGGLVLFYAVRTAIGPWIARRTHGWIKIMEKGFQENAFQYLFMLRLVPFFPCWVSNVSAGALNVPLKTFVFATLLGIMPATFIYTMVGRGLDTYFSKDVMPTMDILLTPAIFWPLVGLFFITFFPLIYKWIKKFQQKS